VTFGPKQRTRTAQNYKHTELAMKTIAAGQIHAKYNDQGLRMKRFVQWCVAEVVKHWASAEPHLCEPRVLGSYDHTVTEYLFRLLFLHLGEIGV